MCPARDLIPLCVCGDHTRVTTCIKQLGGIQCPDLLHKVQTWLPAAYHLHHKSLALKPHLGQGPADSGVQIFPEGLFPSGASSGWSWFGYGHNGVQVLNVNITFMGLPSPAAKLESFCFHGNFNSLIHGFRLCLFHSALQEFIIQGFSELCQSQPLPDTARGRWQCMPGQPLHDLT